MPDNPQDRLRNYMLQQLTTALPHQPGSTPTQVPKEDKIVEWALFAIYDQLQGINLNLPHRHSIKNERMKPERMVFTVAASPR